MSSIHNSSRYTVWTSIICCNIIIGNQSRFLRFFLHVIEFPMLHSARAVCFDIKTDSTASNFQQHIVCFIFVSWIEVKHIPYWEVCLKIVMDFTVYQGKILIILVTQIKSFPAFPKSNYNSRGFIGGGGGGDWRNFFNYSKNQAGNSFQSDKIIPL